MSQTTPRLKFITFLENDYVNFNDINHNFEILEKTGLCVESGTNDVTRSGVSANWYYKKFLNSTKTSPMYTVEASTFITNEGTWTCKEDITKGRQSCWISDKIKVPLPNIISSSNIYDMQASIRLSSSTTDPNINWITFEKDDLDGMVQFRAISPVQEKDGIPKIASIQVKAILY